MENFHGCIRSFSNTLVTIQFVILHAGGNDARKTRWHCQISPQIFLEFDPDWSNLHTALPIAVICVWKQSSWLILHWSLANYILWHCDRMLQEPRHGKKVIHPLYFYSLCFLPIQIKSKYYPWALLLLFSAFFGFQIDLFVGIGVGYLNVYNVLAKLQLSSPKAKLWENKLPFKKFNQRSGMSFIFNAF